MTRIQTRTCERLAAESGQCNAVEIVEVWFVLGWEAKMHGVVKGCLFSKY